MPPFSDLLTWIDLVEAGPRHDTHGRSAD
jgi:hypothetical protein